MLPSAKIPILLHEKSEQSQESTKSDSEDGEAIKLAKINRAQLALGVNELNRTIKKNLVSAALLANDIVPRFLIHHLNLLCMHNQIPFLHVPELREITQKCLGFPCIALGFKKNSEEFNEVIKEIQLVAPSTKRKLEKPNLPESESSDSDEEENTDNLNCLEGVTNNDKPFTYLYRSSVKERVFKPENSNFAKEQEVEFISVEENDDNYRPTEKNNIPKVISANQVKKKKNKFLEIDKFESSDNDRKQYEVPRKKTKPDCTTDKVEDHKNFKYSSANIIKMYSNEKRAKKRQKFSQ